MDCYFNNKELSDNRFIVRSILKNLNSRRNQNNRRKLGGHLCERGNTIYYLIFNIFFFEKKTI